jgi:hypothetical protein
VTVKAANAVSGNAVVKIYKTGDGTQTPVWSYHIWVTDYTGAELKFPVSRAYTFESGAFTSTLHVDSSTGSTYTGGFSAEVVWADAAVIDGTPTVSGSGNTAIVNVKAAAAVGNAVVKICKSGETTPVWSYHIWVTGYDPTKNTYTNAYTYNSTAYKFVFMDRNLGATFAGTGSGLGTGLFYQWGRKDPFPATLAPGATQPGGGSFTAFPTDATVGTVENTIKNPSVFYAGSSTSSRDWHYTSRDNELWGHSGSKTIYDPCPSGWRVPANSNMSEATSPWYGFTKDNGDTWNVGYNWGNNAVYPAAGRRHSVDGGLDSVGNLGHCWSASPVSSTSYASSLTFTPGLVNLNGGNSRAYGFTVRCTQE